MKQAIDVVYLSYKDDVPPKGYWDMAMVEDLLNKKMWSWQNQYDFNETTIDQVTEGAVIVFPARNQVDCVQKLNDDLAKLKWVVLILTSDEESVFPVEAIYHPNIKIWVMSPKPGRHDIFTKLGSGYTPKLRSSVNFNGKVNDWFFAGQINNTRREQCYHELLNMAGGEAIGTAGFTQGLSQEEYYKKLSEAKVAPAPSGIQTPDSFRLFEALECACIPIADELCDVRDHSDISYWTWFFGETPPFPLLKEYVGLKEYVKEQVDNWVVNSNRVFAWWQQYKRKLAYQLRKDIATVSGIDFDDNITVLIPTSPIPSHPETTVIEQCIKDVRAKLPEAEIIIMIDGVNPKQNYLKERYEEYVRRLLWKCNYEWHNIVPVIFEVNTHQVGMTKKCLEMVTTPAILFVEHDAPICSDVEFGYSWDELVAAIVTGDANVIRFHHEAKVLPSSQQYLMGGIEYVNGVPMVKTMEWSQRPHLAGTKFYKDMLDTHFSPDAFGMIEDRIYGIVRADCEQNGIYGWYRWRVWIFHPEGDNIKRSYTLDGRQEEPKFDEEFHY